jgi:hypothetical protein
MLLSYHINLVKLVMLWLSKILKIVYNLGWKEYIARTQVIGTAMHHTRALYYFFRFYNGSSQRARAAHTCVEYIVLIFHFLA